MTVSKLYPVATSPAKLDQAAEALAHLQQMNDALIDARDEIAQLKADLHREQDRFGMMTEERDRYRADAHTYRDLLIKLATQMASIGLMTTSAQDILQQVYELTNNHQPAATIADITETLAAGE